MLFEAGILRDTYPLRAPAGVSAGNKHSLACTHAKLRRVRKLFHEFSRQIKDSASNSATRAGADCDSYSVRLDADVIAREFARFSAALSAQQDMTISRLHIESAYALLRRRVEGVPHRIDRVISAGLAAAVLARTGMRVHLIVDAEMAISYTEKWLFPVFDQLGLGAGTIEAGADEAARRAAYRQDITLLTARECAMDFLRDAINWPQRGDSVSRAIDRLMGEKSRHRPLLMRGLPCAIHVDIDSALIDNARTPIVLTKDGHPMHEVDELKRGLEMVQHLQAGQHFVLTGEGAEVALTELGKQQLQAWAEQFGGIWSAPHVAELMLSVVIVVTHLVKPEIHYRISRQSVVWLVQDRLVPGMEFYSKPFITRVVEIREECAVTSQREVAGRASYQQIFNRYVHLCGVCHSLDQIEHELRFIYGLKCRRRWPESRRGGFRQVRLVQNDDEKLEWLHEWVTSQDTGTCLVITANSVDMLQQLNASLAPIVPDLKVLTEPGETNLIQLLQPGTLVIALAPVMDYLLPALPETIRNPVRIVVTQRSVRHLEDQRNLFWMQAQAFDDCETIVLLATDDELFAGFAVTGLQNLGRFLGARFSAYLMERWIRRNQVRKGRDLYKVRRNLLNYDASMQGLLSFSGRGLYE